MSAKAADPAEGLPGADEIRRVLANAGWTVKQLVGGTLEAEDHTYDVLAKVSASCGNLRAWAVVAGSAQPAASQTDSVPPGPADDGGAAQGGNESPGGRQGLRPRPHRAGVPAAGIAPRGLLAGVRRRRRGLRPPEIP